MYSGRYHMGRTIMPWNQSYALVVSEHPSHRQSLRVSIPPPPVPRTPKPHPSSSCHLQARMTCISSEKVDSLSCTLCIPACDSHQHHVLQSNLLRSRTHRSTTFFVVLAFLWKIGFVWPPYPLCFRSYRLGRISLSCSFVSTVSSDVVNHTVSLVRKARPMVGVNSTSTNKYHISAMRLCTLPALYWVTYIFCRQYRTTQWEDG